MSRTINLIFQIENTDELKSAISKLFNQNDSALDLNNITHAYRTNYDNLEHDVVFVENNDTDLNETIYQFIVLRTFEAGIANESKSYIFEYNKETQKYEFVSFDKFNFDLKPIPYFLTTPNFPDLTRKDSHVK